jgi:hypothetical protein
LAKPPHFGAAVLFCADIKKNLVTDRWIENHAIASWPKIEHGQRGMVVLIDGKDAGIVCYDLDYSFGLELEQTQPPTPEQLGFDVNSHHYDYNEYYRHPSLCEFQPEINWLWEGTFEDVVYAAINNTDLMFPNRKISDQDSDYLEMSNLYAEIRKYLKRQEDKAKKRKEKNKRLNENGGYSSVFDESEL